MPNNIIIAGIHTGIGKTVCSTVICEALGYDYWKPVQAGDLDQSDTMFVQKNTTNNAINFHPERHRLTTPMSPHKAAYIDGLTIKKEDFILPIINNNLLIETAGGVMSPLANNFLVIDLIQCLNVPVILVSNNYLGSINHTLLTIEALRSKNIQIQGIVYSGEVVASSREFISQYSNIHTLFSIPQFDTISADGIAAFVAKESIKIQV
jgi:dethiobiotin synthetase